jgi:hypothetical protein
MIITWKHKELDSKCQKNMIKKLLYPEGLTLTLVLKIIPGMFS